MWGFEPRTQKRALVCAAASAACAMIGFVYQLFGHGVTSRCMTLMFLVFLLGGTAQLCLWLALARPRRFTELVRWAQNILFSGLAALTAGLALQGVFDIAGADSPYPVWFMMAGIALAGLGSIRLWSAPVGDAADGLSATSPDEAASIAATDDPTADDHGDR